MNTLPSPAQNEGPQREPEAAAADLPDFLLSAAPPCQVELIADPRRQTRPSRTWAELLADGQCEV